MCKSIKHCAERRTMPNNTFDEIYASHFLYVRRFLLRLCKGNEYTADDLTQETFFQAYKSINRFSGNCRVETWLCSIAQNVFYAFLRKEKMLKHLDEISHSNTGYVVQNEFFLEHDIAVAISRFSDQTKNVLSYRLFHEMPYAEIANLLGISENSAKVIFYRGRLKLKEILEKEYGYEI